MRTASALALVTLLALASATTAAATAETTLDAALRAGHDVFLVVTDPQAAGVEAARDLAQRAAALAPGATVVEMDRQSPENAALVARFRLAVVPVPLVLVVARNGVASGGALPGKATPAQLAAMVPTAKKAEYLKALSEGRCVFLVLGRADMPQFAAVTQTCEAARAALNREAQANVKVGETMPKDQASVLSLALDDPAEQRFLAEIKADARRTQPTVLVVNAKGQTTSTILEPAEVTVDALVAAAKKKAAECCPGGKC